ncbi:ketopantoate reductase family protein [Lacimicrobium alkaliphilum]|uniref:2-dehydropantoate 2-reductase n=1 Tax=Lacimicrobium alkaliphilum TaxID=1526571 RepID=A0ABQ1R3N5_9ALTE|nr:2-dehydropantoate 2-reductase [Lacimicrobium alkaliphilum]GGD57113.1 2-dehydropantoate 2-reductase [Lacimicrobium alkaliphilum]
MKIVLMGQGAIGSLLAGICETKQLDYAVITRNPTCQPVQLTFVNDQYRQFTPPQLLPTQLQGDELLVMPLKAFQVVPAVTQLKPYLSRQTLVLLNNGMGVTEQVSEILPDNALIAGISKKAVYKQGKKVYETAVGTTELGWISQAEKSGSKKSLIQKRINTLLSPCCWHQVLLPLQWQKLAINAVINPLTALYNINNGALLRPEYQQEITQLCEETKTLMKHKGIAGWNNSLDELNHVISNTADNYSSMHQDIAHNRATEIDYINGYLVRQGQQAGLDMTAHYSLWQRVKALEQATSR